MLMLSTARCQQFQTTQINSFIRRAAQRYNQGSVNILVQSDRIDRLQLQLSFRCSTMSYDTSIFMKNPDLIFNFIDIVLLHNV